MRRFAASQRDQMCLALTVKLSFVNSTGLGRNQRRFQAFFDKPFPNTLHGRRADIHSLADGCVRPAGPAPACVRLQQNPGVYQLSGRPLPGRNQRTQRPALLVGQCHHISLPHLRPPCLWDLFTKSARRPRPIHHFTCQRALIKDLQMEAGGIEPPSRDGSKSASTCIAGLLDLGSANADRQAPAFPSPTAFSRSPGQASGSR